MSISQTAVKKIRSHMEAMRNEEGMEAAQVILILVLVVLGLLPVIMLIKNTLTTRASDVNSGIGSIN